MKLWRTSLTILSATQAAAENLGVKEIEERRPENTCKRQASGEHLHCPACHHSQHGTVWPQLPLKGLGHTAGR